MALVFFYGTLRLPSVQQSVFGRLLTGEADAVVGHELTEVVITDPAVITASGSAVHPGLVPVSAASAAVEGTVFDLSEAELDAADAYEVDAYVRYRQPEPAIAAHIEAALGPARTVINVGAGAGCREVRW